MAEQDFPGEVVLVRNGTKTDQGPIGFEYPVVERATWYPAFTGISLALYGLQGEWLLFSVEEPLNETIGAPLPMDYYSLPLLPGAEATDPPHQEA